jgi:hypothetical protein
MGLSLVSVVALRCLIESDEVSADVVGVGDAKVGVEG